MCTNHKKIYRERITSDSWPSFKKMYQQIVQAASLYTLVHSITLNIERTIWTSTSQGIVKVQS